MGRRRFDRRPACEASERADRVEPEHHLYHHQKLIAKGAIERLEPNFTCRAAVTKEQVQQCEAEELIDKLFDGSAELFLSAYVSGKGLSDSEIDGLRRLVERLK